MNELEQQREVADAILLERAAKVLRRRHDFRARETLERFRFVAWVLEYEAQQLRGEADHSA